MKKVILATVAVATLGSVSTVEAQPNRRIKRDTEVVTVRHGRAAHPQHRRAKHVRRAPAHPRYIRATEWELKEQKRDLRQIRDISRAWHHATVRRSHYEQQLVDRRLAVWLERELRDSRRPGSDPYLHDRLYELSRQLDALHWRVARGVHRRHDYRRKARILDELVLISETEVQRARERVPYDVRWSLALR